MGEDFKFGTVEAMIKQKTGKDVTIRMQEYFYQWAVFLYVDGRNEAVAVYDGPFGCTLMDKYDKCGDAFVSVLSRDVKEGVTVVIK